MRRVALALLLALVVPASMAAAGEPAKYRFQPGGRVQAVRTADVNADGRLDVVLLLAREVEGGGRVQELVLLETPESPVRGRFYGEAAVRRIPVDVGPLATAGAVAIGRFGETPAFRMRFLAPDGIREVTPDGTIRPPEGELNRATLLGRSPGRDLVFWDQVGDLDGDGRDELWFPLGHGAGTIHVLAGERESSRTLDLVSANRGVTDDEHLLRRHAYVPMLEAVDLDGDGRKELVGYRDDALVVWPFAASSQQGAVSPAYRIALPFVKHDLGPDEVHTPRVQLRDVNADGKTDLLVTLVTGNRRQLGSFRTRLLHYPGPFRDATTGALVAPRVRIDTESVALHPHFVDLDGDGDLDYLSDSIRGTKLDLVKRVLGQDPTIWYVGFRFDTASGTFETVPSFSVERQYSRDEAVSNRFGRTGFFEGDFDGDRFKDLLDLGDLSGLEVLRGTERVKGGVGDPVVFTAGIQPRLRVRRALAADALVADLGGDGTADAIVWTEDTLYLLITEAAR